MRRFTMGEVAKELDVHVRSVWRWALDGVRGRKLKTTRIGGRRFVMDADLQNFLAQEEGGSPRTPATAPSTVDARRLDELLGRQPSDRRRR